MLKKAQNGGGWLTWVFSTEDIAPIEEKFGRNAVEGHRTRPDGVDLKWKQIGVKEIGESGELPFFIEWLTSEHPSQDGKSVARINNISIADKSHLGDSWFRDEILGSLGDIEINWLSPSQNYDQNGITSVTVSLNGNLIHID